MTVMKCTTNGPKIDETGALLKIDCDGFVKIDGIKVCRRVLRGGRLYLQFLDRDRMRALARQTEFVEVPLTVVCETLSMGEDWQEESVDA